MAEEGANYGTPLGIAGTGLMLIIGAVFVGIILCGGGFGGAIMERFPEIVFAKKPVVIPATSHRLPDVNVGAGVPVAHNPDPEPRRWAEPDRVPVTKPTFRDPARWTEPSVEPTTPLLSPPPLPVQPSMAPVGGPVAPAPPPIAAVAPVAPVAPPPTGPMASVSVSGDAVSVFARSASGSVIRLPGSVPPGPYDVVVTFAGKEPFSAGSILVLDASPRSIICRSSLGICKVR